MSESVAVAKLISALLLAIASYTGFTVPKAHPEIAFLAPGELQHRFCGWALSRTCLLSSWFHHLSGAGHGCFP